MSRIAGTIIFGVALALNVGGVVRFLDEDWRNVTAALDGWHFWIVVYSNIFGEIGLLIAIIRTMRGQNESAEGIKGRSGGLIGIASGVSIMIGSAYFSHNLGLAVGSIGATCWISFVLTILASGLILYSTKGTHYQLHDMNV